MSLIADLAEWSLLGFGFFLFVLQVVVREIGTHFGVRSAQAGVTNEGVAVIVGSILGLLAFVLALTLSTASSRYVERRAGAVEEANAIGTAWLQARALGDPSADDIAELLEEYIAVRISYVEAERGSETVQALSVRTAQLQAEIWEHVSVLVRERRETTTSSLMNAVNHAFDMTTAQRFAVALNLPDKMIWLVLAFTMIGMFALGWQLGLIGRPNRPLALLMSLLWAAVLVQILDMGTARLGNYRTDLEPYYWTIEGFTGSPEIDSRR
ncbi:hypothetical protein ACRDNQ_18490 [Palleronia sp. KMU-117]|uniref:bestrophin-like domain n=1 Tax=Palleronia sp. KMU-117 TaxID=3434108 RepID=UPI003D710CC6